MSVGTGDTTDPVEPVSTVFGTPKPPRNATIQATVPRKTR
jgi:hypothetical protein